MIIRPYEEKDKENVRFVCLHSEGECRMTEIEQEYILTTYCDYYIEQEDQNCFVAADENDRAIAYIICTEDFDSYKKAFKEEYIPRLDEEMVVWGFNARKGADGSTKLQEKHKKDFPAHLHIDILPEYHRQGIGHRLVDTLAEHLKSKGVCGVMLTVGAANEQGLNFYKKYGFEFIEKDGDDVAFGLRF